MTYAAQIKTVGRQPLTVVELDLDTCSEVYGNGLTPDSFPPRVSPSGGTLVWANGMWMQERMQSVYRTGLRQNPERYGGGAGPGACTAALSTVS